MKKNIILAELGTSHLELLYSHLQILRENEYEVTCFFNDKLKSIITQDFKTEIVYFNEGEPKNQICTQLKNLIKEKKAKQVVVNTAYNSILKHFCIKNLLNNSFEMIGVCHDVKKLKYSLQQILISLKIRKYFVLNDFLVKNKFTTGIFAPKIESFYPIFFADIPSNVIEKKEDEVYVTMPGGVHTDRRDYLSFFEMLKKNISEIPKNIKFIFLGNYSNSPIEKEFEDFLAKTNLQKQVVTFKGFIRDGLFYEYLKKSDVILPLLHTKKKKYNMFLTQKISGCFNLGLGFKIPFIFEKAFDKIEDFKNTSFFYENIEDLMPILKQIATDKTTIEDKKSNFDQLEKIKFSFQQKKYIHFLEN